VSKKTVVGTLALLALTAQVSFAQTSKWIKSCEEVVSANTAITLLETRTYEEKGIILGDIFNWYSRPASDYRAYEQQWVEAAVVCFNVKLPMYPEDLRQRYFPLSGEPINEARLKMLARKSVTSKAQQIVNDPANQQAAADERATKLRQDRENTVAWVKRECAKHPNNCSAHIYYTKLKFGCQDKIARKLKSDDLRFTEEVRDCVIITSGE
jgi:hypothetical protein